MSIAVYITIGAASALAVLLIGAAIYRAGVRQGMLMSKMAWNLQRDEDPLDDLEDSPKDTSPDAGDCD